MQRSFLRIEPLAGDVSTRPVACRNGCARPARTRSEGGFTIVELMVVMLIIAMIGGIAAMSTRSAQSNGTATQARSVARTLGEGIEQFQRDHGGRPPGNPGTVDWIEPPGAPVNGWRSPVDQGNGNRPYIKSANTEQLATGTLQLTTGAAPRSGSPSGFIRYSADATLQLYGLTVYVRRNGAYAATCFVTNAEATGTTAGFYRGLGARAC